MRIPDLALVNKLWHQILLNHHRAKIKNGLLAQLIVLTKHLLHVVVLIKHLIHVLVRHVKKSLPHLQQQQTSSHESGQDQPFLIMSDW